jgi:hypothetical protein
MSEASSSATLRDVPVVADKRATYGAVEMTRTWYSVQVQPKPKK